MKKIDTTGDRTMTVRVTETPLVISPAAANIQHNDVPHDEEYWINHISASWQNAAESIIETGRRLNKAKDELAHGGFTKMINERLPFGPRTAQMLMTVAKHPVLANPNHGSHLPPSWRTLSELATLPPKTVLARIEDGTITPKMERKDVARLTTKPGNDKAKHTARMTPILRLKEENEELVREKADLEERLTNAECDAEADTMFLFKVKDVEFVVSAIIAAAGEDKAKAIAAGIIKRFKRKPGRPAKTATANAD
jgi:hypothetical protein